MVWFTRYHTSSTLGGDVCRKWEKRGQPMYIDDEMWGRDDREVEREKIQPVSSV
jgi:hypothetical protein